MIYQIVFGIVYSSLLEWWFHKTPLHKGGGVFRTHVVDHHRLSAREMRDPDYEKVIFGSGETVMILVGLLLHLPFLYFVPWTYCVFFVYLVLYLVLHRASHISASWAKRWMPWHYVHHTVNAQSNFGIVHPLVDMALGTYLPLRDRYRVT